MGCSASEQVFFFPFATDQTATWNEGSLPGSGCYMWAVFGEREACSMPSYTVGLTVHSSVSLSNMISILLRIRSRSDPQLATGAWQSIIGFGWI